MDDEHFLSRGIGAWCATFAAGTGPTEGKVVQGDRANGTVSKCAANDGFCGVVAAMGRDGKACSVQLGGLVTRTVQRRDRAGGRLESCSRRTETAA